MNKELILLKSISTDPRFNLAMEEYVFDNMPKEYEYFWLWRNHNTIVVGKHQNTVQEINLPYVKEHDITVVRRLSGGGAVYHDLGNVNFTFIADADNLEALNLQAFCLPIVETLQTMGIDAQVSGRNDITIDGRKFSGNSQYIREKRIMHHGTLMFDSDLSVVTQALQVSADKYESKGFKSVRSRVTSIRPYAPEGTTVDTFQKILEGNIAKHARVVTLNEEQIAQIKKIQEARYNTWEWNFGYSPAYSVTKKRRIEGVGTIEVCMDVKDGSIHAFDTFGDYFGNGATQELKDLLCGCPLTEEAILTALSGFALGTCYNHLTKEQFASLLTQ